MKIKLNKYVLAVIVSLIIATVILVVVFKFDKDPYKLDLDGVSFIHQFKDEEGINLYNRYQVEDGILFQFIGSNAFEDGYGYYYDDEVTELSNLIDNLVLIKEDDYSSWDYDMNDRCYRLSRTEYSNRYKYLFNNEEADLSFDEKYNETIMVNGDSICIADTINDRPYTKIIDTYLINITRVGDKIVIYENVAFVDTEGESFKFYKDLEMKELVYELKKTDEVDISFINNSEVASNVLVELDEKFDVYTYTYVKGENGYYLESIKK